ncbi:tetratricopeptide repeat protein [Aquiflexum sp.]|uniref:tetratricopeptide repeat protein n=1 Tax=Aquiflexum sp. TaxID=1872584 RepID=UPI003594023A
MKFNVKSVRTGLATLVLLSCNKPVEMDTQVRDYYQDAISLCFVPAGVRWDFSGGKAPLLEGMDLIDYPVTTSNELARKYFNQGLLLAYAFNHGESERSFQYAANLDPTFAMAFWGQAYVLGPNYNAGMEEDYYAPAYSAIQKAKLYINSVSAKEADLILAMEKRYAEIPPYDRSGLDMAYAEALAELHEKYPDDAEIAVMYAEALMDLQPWDLYDRQKRPKGNTVLITEILENTIQQNPKHVGAHHLYMHVVEPSDNPQRGLPSARLFDEGLTPLAGHLIHMPSHIYIQTGHYNLGTLSNLRAAKVDSVYIETCKAEGVYPIAYFPHNLHFMAGTAILEGSSKWALYAADRLFEHTAKEVMAVPGFGAVQHYYTIPLFTRVKFGKWEEILKFPQDVFELPYQKGVLHYARGMAFLGKGQLDNAIKELNALKNHIHLPELEEEKIWDINSLDSILEIAALVLEGELAAASNDYTKAIQLLEKATELEDSLLFNEPPDWFLSVRHHLGAVLLEAGDYAKAEEVYLKDLKVYPENGWALKGLNAALEQQGKSAEAASVKDRFEEVWKTADISIVSSRID